MVLQDFVKETLLQLTMGVKEAQEAVKGYGAVINPKFITGSESAKICGEYRPVQNISFEVGLTTASEDMSQKGIGVILGGLKAGYKGNGEKSESAVTNVKFTIPLAFPVDASCSESTSENNHYTPKERHHRFEY